MAELVAKLSKDEEEIEKMTSSTTVEEEEDLREKSTIEIIQKVTEQTTEDVEKEPAEETAEEEDEDKGIEELVKEGIAEVITEATGENPEEGKFPEDEQEEPVEEEVEPESPCESVNTGVNKPILPRLFFTNEQKSDINRAFEFLDQDGAGLIDADDFKIAIKALGYEVTSEELKAMVRGVGEANTGKLSASEFNTLIMRKTVEKDSESDIIKSFMHFDIEDNGYLTLENMRAVADILGEDLNDEEISEMFDAADEDGDGFVSKEEFIKMMNKCVTLVTP